MNVIEKRKRIIILTLGNIIDLDGYVKAWHTNCNRYITARSYYGADLILLHSVSKDLYYVVKSRVPYLDVYETNWINENTATELIEKIESSWKPRAKSFDIADIKKFSYKSNPVVDEALDYVCEDPDEIWCQSFKIPNNG